MTMVFTRHAVERYRQFHMLDRPLATDDEARQILEAHAGNAHRLGRTFRGDPLWAIASLGIEVVAKHEDGWNICVTVLPPPRFRGLTPLQAEVVAASVARINVEIAVVAAEIDSLPPPATKPDTMVARREAQEAAQQRADLKKRHQSVLAERDVQCAALKTMRHQITSELHRGRALRALKIAMRHLRASTDPAAPAALAEIEALPNVEEAESVAEATTRAQAAGATPADPVPTPPEHPVSSR